MGVIPNRLIQDLFNYGKSQLHIGHSCGIYPFQFLLQPAENRSFGSAAESTGCRPNSKSYGAYLAGRVAHLRKTSTPLPTITLKLSTKTPTIRICSVVFMSFLPPKGELPKRRATPKYLCKKAIKTTSPTSSSP